MTYVRAELKADAKSQLSGNWGRAIGAMLLVTLFGALIGFIVELLMAGTAAGGLLGYIDKIQYMTDEEILRALSGFYGWAFLCSLVVLVLTAPVSVGYYFFNLGLMRRENVTAFTPFQGFRYLGKTIGLTLMINIFISLWSLLFLIPGIIKTYSYAMAPYIWSDHRDMSIFDAITQSRKMMVGHKWEFFVLNLSFILWVLLVSLTFGIALLYVGPYMEMTFANFYERLKKDYEAGTAGSVA